jgi:hypothetical protein
MVKSTLQTVIDGRQYISSILKDGALTPDGVD